MPRHDKARGVGNPYRGEECRGLDVNRTPETKNLWLLCAGLGGLAACGSNIEVTAPKTDRSLDHGGAAGAAAIAGPNVAGQSGVAVAGQGGTLEPDAADVVVEGEYPIAMKPGLAPTPPMGWSSWNTFACKIKATDVISVANTST